MKVNCVTCTSPALSASGGRPTSGTASILGLQGCGSGRVGEAWQLQHKIRITQHEHLYPPPKCTEDIYVHWFHRCVLLVNATFSNLHHAKMPSPRPCDSMRNSNNDDAQDFASPRPAETHKLVVVTGLCSGVFRGPGTCAPTRWD